MKRRTDQQLAQELEAHRARYFTLESKKRLANWEQLEAICEEQEAITDQIAEIYKNQRQRAKRRGKTPPRKPPH